MDFGIIIQARMSSKRFPGKVLKKIVGKPLLEIMLNRVWKIKNNVEIIVATSNLKIDDPIENLCKKLSINYFRGPHHDVMNRYIKCANQYNIKTIIRLTGDAPLIDPAIVDLSINEYKKRNVDYLSTTYPPELRQYPDGMDVEIFKAEELESYYYTNPSSHFREHVTFQFWKNNYSFFNLKPSKNLSHFRLTVDYKEDFKLIKNVIENLSIDCSLKQIIDYLDNNPHIMELNKQYEFGQGWNN